MNSTGNVCKLCMRDLIASSTLLAMMLLSGDIFRFVVGWTTEEVCAVNLVRSCVYVFKKPIVFHCMRFLLRL